MPMPLLTSDALSEVSLGSRKSGGRTPPPPPPPPPPPVNPDLICQTDRPCVAAVRMPVVGLKSSSRTWTLGSPLPKRTQVAPSSIEAHTPLSLPTYRMLSVGSKATAKVGRSGSPAPALPLMSNQLLPPLLV